MPVRLLCCSVQRVLVTRCMQPTPSPHDRRLVDETVKEFGRLDILVNNASQQVSDCRHQRMIDGTSSRPVHCGCLLMDPWLG